MAAGGSVGLNIKDSLAATSSSTCSTAAERYEFLKYMNTIVLLAGALKRPCSKECVNIPPGRSVECEIVCSEGYATSIVCAAAHLRDERPRIQRGRVEKGWQRMICCCGSPSPPDLGGVPPPTHRTITLKAANDLAIFASPLF